MISARYSIHEFLDAVQGKSVFEAISMAQHECYEAEQMTRGGKRGAPAARAAGCDRYAADLKGFIFFLSNGVQPAGIDNGTFISFRKAVPGILFRLQKPPRPGALSKEHL